MIEKTAEHTGIWGRSKSGKSTMLKRLLKSKRRLVVFDCLDEYAGICAIKAGKPIDVLKAMRRGSFRVRYVPDGDEYDPVAELDRLCRALLKAQEPYKLKGEGEVVTLAVEEMAECAPNVRRMFSAFNAVCARGRHSGIEIYGVSQRMADVTTAFRGNTNADYFFPLRTESDFKAARDLCKAVNANCERDLAALTRGQYVFIGNGEYRKGHNKEK